MKSELNIGIVGAGGFATFAAKAFQKVPGIQIAGVTDIDEFAASQLARELQAEPFPSLEALLQDARIHLIYIATPPYLHYSQSKRALEAGKHVICEKPAALKTAQAEELADLARTRQLLYTVNLMQRYNPLYFIVNEIIEKKYLGDFLHGFFENYASDEKLIPAHWFWDLEKSGGIFIEHGVHFFDLFSGWLGQGRLVESMQIQRPDVESQVIDRVLATVLYQDGPVNFYHGFNQPKVLDRQEMRLQFDRGDITLYEWVPVKIRMHGVFKSDDLEHIEGMLPGCSIVRQIATAGRQSVKGKFKDIAYDTLVTLESGDIADKMNRYEELVISMIKDQWNWIEDRTHRRVIDDNNAVESLRMAEQATIQAKNF